MEAVEEGEGLVEEVGADLVFILLATSVDEELGFGRGNGNGCWEGRAGG